MKPLVSALAAAAVLAMLAPGPASAAGNGIKLNGLGLNGMRVNGASFQGRSVQGSQANGLGSTGVEHGVPGRPATFSPDALPLGGVTVYAVHIPKASPKLLRTP